MGLRQERIEFDRLASELKCTLESGGIQVIVVEPNDPNGVLRIGKEGVRTGEIGIDGERLLDEAARV